MDTAGASLGFDTLLSRYRIGELLGAGGMGEVYEATDLHLGRRVALKILPASGASDPARVARFVREAQVASALHHPAIVTVFDAGTALHENGTPVHYLSMELLEGETLAAWARTNRDRSRRLDVLAQIADGLAAAHAAGVVHRDLKPENVVLTRGRQAKIVDFGVAKLTERPPGPGAGSDTAPSALIGTAAFMSPEQVSGGTVDHRADVFAFGCVLHAVFAGRSPFVRDTPVETMHAVLNDEAPPLADPDVQRIARRCLAKDPDERYQSMRDVALDLRDAAAGDSLSATRAPGGGWRRAAGGLLIAALVISVILLATRREPQAPSPVSMLRLTNSGNVTCGTISPDGNYVVHSVDEGDTSSIRVRQIATGRTVVIVPPAEEYDYELQVSHDGNYVYYARTQRSEPNVASLYRVPILGGEPKKIAHDIEFNFDLSPDGRSVAFVRRDKPARSSGEQHTRKE